MQFVPTFPSVEAPRPSVFGQFIPVNQQSQPAQETPASWLQVPPAHMSWGIPMASQPSIVRFTAERPDNRPLMNMTLPFAQQCKRKNDIDLEVRPVKLHITEEKMAAHLSQLHISSNYTSHQSDSVEVSKPKQDVSFVHQVPGPSAKTQYKRLVLCDEIRQLQNEPILPSSLLAKMEKPSMALVLWQPPAGILGETLKNAAQALDRNKMETEEQQRQQQTQQQQPQSVTLGPIFPILDNNNTSAAIDLNSLAMTGFGQFQPPTSDIQAMDL